MCILGSPNFQNIGQHHLKRIYELIDQKYFNKLITSILKSESRVLTFRLSGKMTQRAGQLFTDKDTPFHHELSVSSFLIFEAFSGGNSTASRPVSVNGLVCYDRVHCLLRIVEHEIVHLLFCCDSIGRAMGLVDSKGDYKEPFHGPTFQLAVKRFFGHTDWQHTLVTRDEVAFIQQGIEVGALVSFQNDGKTLQGKVNRVQKRVTVLVQDNMNKEARLFSDGNKYLKYYVPLNLCKKV